jgi:hypothetical protein
MTNICSHCDEPIIGDAYRVTSEEDGVILLDMIVCSSCAAQAKSLQLDTQPLTPDHFDIPDAGEPQSRSRLHA